MTSLIKYLLLLTLLSLLGCAAPNHDDPIQQQLFQAQRQVPFDIHVAQLPDDFALKFVNVMNDSSEQMEGIPPLSEENRVSLAYESGQGFITVTQFIETPEEQGVPPHGQGVRALMVGNTPFLLRNLNMAGQDARHLYYARGNLQLHLTTSIDDQIITDADLAEIAQSLRPLMP